MSDVILDEKGGQAYFAVTLDKASVNNVSVSYATQDSSANSGSDYQAVNGSVTFLPGETAKMIPVTVFDDSQTENTENFNFILSNAVNATLPLNQTQAIIPANDKIVTGEQPFISVSDIVIGEIDTTATFLVTLNQPSNQTVSVTYKTFDQSASSYNSPNWFITREIFLDYNSSFGTLNFAPGETSKTVTVTIWEEDETLFGYNKDVIIVDDTVIETREDDTVIETRETFGLSLSSPINAQLSKNSAIATIIDNDTIGNPNISVADLRVSESDGLALFAITLDKASTNNVSVSYSTGDGSANSGSDYQAVNGTVTFLPGETAKTIPVILVDNDQREYAETFTLNLSNASNGVITDSQGTANINDTDTGTGGGNKGGGDTLLNTTLNRFRNKLVAGSYLFATEGESQSIIVNFSNVFELEGAAFQVSSQAGDNLVKFNRFRNKLVSGTYLFATEGESQSIIANFSQTFELEGTAFYAYGADAGLGTDYYRLANLQVAGTYLFVDETEKNSALAQFPNLFRNEGVAFEVG